MPHAVGMAPARSKLKSRVGSVDEVAHSLSGLLPPQA